MLKFYNIVIAFFFVTISTFSQQIVEGTFLQHSNQEITLFGYERFKIKELAKTTIDSSGNFTLNYDNTYKGMAYLETSDKSQLFIVINESNINVEGTHLKEPDGTSFITSKENQLFTQYAIEHNMRENALAGWKHLLPLYHSTFQEFKTLGKLSAKNEVLTSIQKEIERLEKEDALFLNNIDKTTYVSWFLPLRKLLDDIPLSAQRYTERIPEHLADFRKINFNNDKLITSGILADLIESHYWLIENSGLTMDSMYEEMNMTTYYLINNLKENENQLNEVADFLFNLLEKRSLLKASEYLALQLLTQSSCTIENDLAKQLETYRIMKIGNTAKDILFTGKKMLNGIEIPIDLKLSTMNNKYTLVVFGASWCPKCAEEIPKITVNYLEWKQKGIETVFISLDTDENEYLKFVKNFPFLSSCDYKGWKTKAAQDYYVFSTPIMFLLDKDRKILLRPISVEQVYAWVKYKI